MVVQLPLLKIVKQRTSRRTLARFTADNVNQIMEKALVEVFEQVLQNAGVFKNTEDGEKGWDKFITALTEDVD